MMLRTKRGRTLRVLLIIDGYTCPIVASYIAPSSKKEEVARLLLDVMIRGEARPENIRSDNGSEFIANTVQEFIAANGIKGIYIAPGCPWQNGVIESFNPCFRREFADRWWFHNYDDIVVAMGEWL